MNTFKHILLLTVGILLFSSCSDGDSFVSDIENSENLASFTNNSKTVANIADGSEYPVKVRMKVEGPSVQDLSGDVDVTVEPDFTGIPDSLKAEQGRHFRLGQNQVTLTESDDYIGNFTFTMLTEGINAPQEPRFKLKAIDASGDGNIINSGKPIDVTLSYGCFSTLDQTSYNVETTYTAVDGSVSNHTWTEKWTKTGVGTFRTERVGHWTPEALGGTPGMTLRDVCGTISIPEQNLVDLYSNLVAGGGSVDENTGVVSLDYTICASGDCREYEATYTPAQ